jgi:hypothetical protein
MYVKSDARNAGLDVSNTIAEGCEASRFKDVKEPATVDVNVRSRRGYTATDSMGDPDVSITCEPRHTTALSSGGSKISSGT